MLSYFSTNPSINLNFSIFLYKTGAAKEASKQLNIYDRKMEEMRSIKGNEIDQEVTALIGSKYLPKRGILEITISHKFFITLFSKYL